MVQHTTPYSVVVSNSSAMATIRAYKRMCLSHPHLQRESRKRLDQIEKYLRSPETPSQLILTCGAYVDIEASPISNCCGLLDAANLRVIVYTCTPVMGRAPDPWSGAHPVDISAAVTSLLVSLETSLRLWAPPRSLRRICKIVQAGINLIEKKLSTKVYILSDLLRGGPEGSTMVTANLVRLFKRGTVIASPVFANYNYTNHP